MPRKSTSHLVNIAGSVPCSSETQQNQYQQHAEAPSADHKQVSKSNSNPAVERDPKPAVESNPNTRTWPTFAQEAGRRRSLRSRQLDPVLETARIARELDPARAGPVQGEGQPIFASPLSKDLLALPLSPELQLQSLPTNPPPSHVPSAKNPILPTRLSLRQRRISAEEIEVPPKRPRRLSIDQDPLQLSTPVAVEKEGPPVEPLTLPLASPTLPLVPARRLSLRQQHIPAEAEKLPPKRYACPSISGLALPPPESKVPTATELLETPVIQPRRSSRQQHLPAEAGEVQPIRYNRRRRSTLGPSFLESASGVANDTPLLEGPGASLKVPARPGAQEPLLPSPNLELDQDHATASQTVELVEATHYLDQQHGSSKSSCPLAYLESVDLGHPSQFEAGHGSGHSPSTPITVTIAEQPSESGPATRATIEAQSSAYLPRRSSRFSSTADLPLAPSLAPILARLSEPANPPHSGVTNRRQRRNTSPLKTAIRRSSRLSSTDTPIVTPALSAQPLQTPGSPLSSIADQGEPNGDLDLKPEYEPELGKQKVPPNIPHEPDPESPDPLNIISQAGRVSPLALQPIEPRPVPIAQEERGPKEPIEPIEQFGPVLPSSSLSLPPELPGGLAKAVYPGPDTPPEPEALQDFILPQSIVDQAALSRDLQVTSSLVVEPPLSPESFSGDHQGSRNQPGEEAAATDFIENSSLPSLVNDVEHLRGHLDPLETLNEPARSIDNFEAVVIVPVEPAGHASPRQVPPTSLERTYLDYNNQEQPPPHLYDAPAELVDKGHPAERPASSAVWPDPRAIALEPEHPSTRHPEPTRINPEELDQPVSLQDQNYSPPGSPDSFLANQLLDFARAEVLLPDTGIPVRRLDVASPAPSTREDSPGDTLNRVILEAVPELPAVPQDNTSQPADESIEQGRAQSPFVPTCTQQTPIEAAPDPATPNTRQTSIRLARVDSWSPETTTYRPATSAAHPTAGAPKPPTHTSQQQAQTGARHLGSWVPHDAYSPSLGGHQATSTIGLLLNNDTQPQPNTRSRSFPVELVIPRISITRPEDSSIDQSEPSLHFDNLVLADIEMSDGGSSGLSAPPDSPIKMKQNTAKSSATEAGPSGSTASTTSAKPKRKGGKGNGDKKRKALTADDAIGNILDSNSKPRKRSKDNTPLDPAPSTTVRLKFRVGDGKGSTSPEKPSQPQLSTDSSVESKQTKEQKKKRPSTAGPLPSDPSASTPTAESTGVPPFEGKQPISVTKVKGGSKTKGKATPPPSLQSLDVPKRDQDIARASFQAETLVASSSQPAPLTTGTHRSTLPKKRRNRVDSSDDEADRPVDQAMDVDPPEAQSVPMGGLTPPATTEKLGPGPVQVQAPVHVPDQTKGKPKQSVQEPDAGGNKAKVQGVRTSDQKETAQAALPAGPMEGKEKKKGQKRKQVLPSPSSQSTDPARGSPATLDKPSQTSSTSPSLDNPTAEGSKAKSSKPKKAPARSDAVPGASTAPAVPVAAARPIYADRKGKTATPQPPPPPGQKDKPTKEGQGTTPRPSGRDVPGMSKVPKKDPIGSTRKDKVEASPRPVSSDKPQTKPGPSQPPRKNPISASTSLTLLQQTMAALQGGGSTPKRETVEKTKKPVEKAKPSTYQWGRDYTPNAEQRAELEANRAQREAGREKRRLWSVNPINLQEARDAYRRDAMREHELQLPHPIGIIPTTETSTVAILKMLWAQDAVEDEENRLVGGEAATAAQKRGPSS